MEISEVIKREIMIRIADQQLEFFKNKAKELGLSKEELIEAWS
jgi:predicted DNA binding CopG/RHH family protein